jgi:hypothetical protein
MKIGPVDNWGRPSGPEDKQKRKIQPESGSENPKPESSKDSVEISHSARLMSERVRVSERSNRTDKAGRAPSREMIERAEGTELDETEVRRDKVEQARERVKSGHYDKAEVRKEIARRITDDFIG